MTFKLWCADCGRGIAQGRRSLPQGRARCQPCRHEAHKFSESTWRPRECRTCGSVFPEHHCVMRPNTEPVRRQDRERVAPGLTARKRRELLAKWQRQRRACVYCAVRPADTIDHVVALIRGGTNREGNLVPACRPCNGRKRHRTVMEWRLNKGLPEGYTPAYQDAHKYPPRPRPAAVVQEPPVRLEVACWTCGGSFSQRSPLNICCSEGCRVERNRRITRDKYRALHGMPTNLAEPTSRWKVPA